LAILYLHEEWDEQVIHCNITSSTVFLPDLNPWLWLAEFLSRNEHHSSGHHVVVTPSSPRGFFGYMSPEYMDTGFEQLNWPVEALVDRRLDGKFDSRELMRMAWLGMACTRSQRSPRHGTMRFCGRGTWARRACACLAA
jgi:hypothetical protein